MRFHKLSPQDIVVLLRRTRSSPLARSRVQDGAAAPEATTASSSLDAHCGKDYRRVRIGNRPSRRQAPGHQPTCSAISRRSTPSGSTFCYETIAHEIDLLVQSDDAGSEARLPQATQRQKATPSSAPPHILSRRRRPRAPQIRHRHARRARPSSSRNPGPLAAMLKKLFNRD